MLLLKLLGFLWLLPVTIPFWLLYVLPLLLRRDLRFVRWYDFAVAHFKVVSRHGWYARKWQDWAGFSGPCCIITRSDVSADPYQLHRTLVHEHRHCMQQLLFGPLFHPAYGLCTAVLWVYGTVTNADVHAYLDNPFEVDARVAAGQPRRIERKYWPHGRDDRLPWW